MPGKKLQEYLFQQIKEKLPPETSLAEVIAETLFVSTDSAYRRIRGETPLVLEEANLLCEAFNISLDQLLKAKPNSISFIVEDLDPAPDNFKNFLLNILKTLKKIAASKEKEIIYLSKEIILFHFFSHKLLFSLTYFFWMRFFYKHPDFQNIFTEDVLPKDVEEIGSEIISLYNTIPSVEILNTECINGIISQINYCQNAGAFQSAQDLKRISTSMYNMIEHLRVQAESGCKFLPTENLVSKKQNYQVFHNTVGLADNTILINADGKKTVYLNYETLKYLVTHDENFCEKINVNLQTHMRRNTLISSSSEKQRNIFFNTLLKKLPKSVTTTSNLP